MFNFESFLRFIFFVQKCNKSQLCFTCFTAICFVVMKIVFNVSFSLRNMLRNTEKLCIIRMVKDFNALFCVLQYILSLMASSYVILVFVGMVSLVEINPCFLKAKESEKLILMTFLFRKRMRLIQRI